MNVLTRMLSRVKACLCYKINYPRSYNLLLALIIFLSLILWTSTPEGMVKGKLESWIQQKSAMERGKVKEPLEAKSLEAKSLETESLETEYLEALMAEEESWLMEPWLKSKTTFFGQDDRKGWIEFAKKK